MTTKTNNTTEATMYEVLKDETKRQAAWDRRTKALAKEFVGQMSADDLRGFSRAAWYEGAALHLANSDQDKAAGIQVRDFMAAIEDAVRTAERPCLEASHGGLLTLEKLDLREMRKALGENGAIDLISGLISKRALSTAAALEMVEDSGLL